MTNDHPHSESSRQSDEGKPTDAIPAEELRRAMKAFRKRLKLSRLDAESTLGRSAMSGGRDSGIVAIVPPRQFPKAVWDELVRLERLRYVGQGLYEIAQT